MNTRSQAKKRLATELSHKAKRHKPNASFAEPKFISQSSQSDWTWGREQSELSRNGLKIKVYSKAIKQSELSLAQFDYVSAVSGDETFLAQIAYLFEKKDKKLLEARLFLRLNKKYFETYHYCVLPLHKIKEKVLFTSENGYTCTELLEKDQTKSIVDPAERNARTLRFSHMYAEFFMNENRMLRAISWLTISSVPSQLVGRVKEIKEITRFLVDGINEQHCSSSLYMCGMPGTGKTAAFFCTINNLQNHPELRKAYRFVYVNCLKMGSAIEFYQVLYKEITGQKTSKNRALKLLKTYIEQPHHQEAIVLLVDELDALLNKRQNVLYNLFNLSTAQASNMIVTGIANTMNLTERFLSKIASRIGTKQIVFPPYTREEILRIIQRRLKDTIVFCSDAVCFCSAKIASYSGDIRRALTVCKRAAFLAYETQKTQVTVADMQKAFQQLYGSVVSEGIKHLPTYLKLFLVCTCLELKMRSETVTLYSVLNRMNGICLTQIQISTLDIEEAEEVAIRLQAYRLCELEQQVVKLIVSPDEIAEALEGDPLFNNIESIFS